MYRHRLAYRITPFEIEGFVGRGFTKESAREDAISQIKKKLAIILEDGTSWPVHTFKFSWEKVVEGEASLTKPELESVRNDWNSNMRYP